MKQRSFHLLALLSLLSISSFSFGMKQSPVRGRVAYVEKRGIGHLFDGRLMVHFEPENLEYGSKYKIEGEKYTYEGRVTLQDGTGGNLFFCTNDAQGRLVLDQKGGIYLITHECKNGCLVPVDNNCNNSSGVHVDKGRDSGGLDEKGDPSLFTLLSKKYKAYEAVHPWRVKVGWGVATLGTLWMLKKTYCWCFGSKKDASKKASLRNRR